MENSMNVVENAAVIQALFSLAQMGSQPAAEELDIMIAQMIMNTTSSQSSLNQMLSVKSLKETKENIRRACAHLTTVAQA